MLKGRCNKIQCDRSTWRTKNEIVFMLALLFCCYCCCLWIIVLCICLFVYHLMYLKYFKTGNDGWNKLVPLYPIQWSKLFKSERLVPPMIWIGNFLENSWKILGNLWNSGTKIMLLTHAFQIFWILLSSKNLFFYSIVWKSITVYPHIKSLFNEFTIFSVCTIVHKSNWNRSV